MNIQRGQIYSADLSPVIGSEQGGLRPVLIVSNDIGNRYSPVIIAAPLTSQIQKKRLPTQVILSNCGLRADSLAMCEQLRTLDKKRLKQLMGVINEAQQEEINQAINISFGLNNL